MENCTYISLDLPHNPIRYLKLHKRLEAPETEVKR